MLEHFVERKPLISEECNTRFPIRNHISKWVLLTFFSIHDEKNVSSDKLILYSPWFKKKIFSYRKYKEAEKFHFEWLQTLFPAISILIYFNITLTYHTALSHMWYNVSTFSLICFLLRQNRWKTNELALIILFNTSLCSASTLNLWQTEKPFKKKLPRYNVAPLWCHLIVVPTYTHTQFCCCARTFQKFDFMENPTTDVDATTTQLCKFDVIILHKSRHLHCLFDF